VDSQQNVENIVVQQNTEVYGEEQQQTEVVLSQQQLEAAIIVGSQEYHKLSQTEMAAGRYVTMPSYGDNVLVFVKEQQSEGVPQKKRKIEDFSQRQDNEQEYQWARDMTQKKVTEGVSAALGAPLESPEVDRVGVQIQDTTLVTSDRVNRTPIRNLVDSRNLEYSSRVQTSMWNHPSTVQDESHNKIAHLERELKELKEQFVQNQPQHEQEDDLFIEKERSKIKSWNEVVEAVKRFKSQDFEGIHGSPQKFSRCQDSGGLFDVTSLQPERLPWHPLVKSAMEVCEFEVAKPQSKGKKDLSPLKMGAFLSNAKVVQPKFFKPLGQSSTFYPAKVNANLKDLSSKPFKQPGSLVLSDKDLEVKEAAARELAILHSHSLWMADLMSEVNDKLEAGATIQDVVQTNKRVLHHMKSVNNLITDKVSTQLSNTILQRRDSQIKSIPEPIPYELIAKLRASPFLDEKLFDIEDEDVEWLKDHRKNLQTMQILTKTSQVAARATVQEFKQPSRVERDPKKDTRSDQPKQAPEFKAQTSYQGKGNSYRGNKNSQRGNTGRPFQYGSSRGSRPAGRAQRGNSFRGRGRGQYGRGRRF